MIGKTSCGWAKALSLMLAVGAGCIAGCRYDSSSDGSGANSSAASASRGSGSLPRGIYLVERRSNLKDDLIPVAQEETLLAYDRSKFFAPSDSDQIEYFVLHRQKYIPFELSADPEAVAAENGKADLSLTFSERSAAHIEAFTRKYVGRQVVIVVGGEIITNHKIRSVISDGALRISRCSDNGCEIIMAKLTE